MADGDPNTTISFSVGGFIKGMAIAGPIALSIFAVITQGEAAIGAWDRGGWPTMATRAWVRDDTRDFKTKINEMQLDMVRGQLDQNLIARNQLEIATLKYTDDESKTKAAQEMRRIDYSISMLRDQIRTMLSARGPQ